MKDNKMQQMLKQAQSMQKQMKSMQEQLAHKSIQASAGGDMVVVHVSGQQQIQDIKIHPEVVDKEDIEMLQDLVMSAVNEALEKSSQMANQEMSKLTGGFPSLEGLI